MNVYSVEIKICGTVYVKARSEAEAIEEVRKLDGAGIELAEDDGLELPITGKNYDDPDLPDVSMSPAMTVYGPWEAEPSVEVVCEGVGE